MAGFNVAGPADLDPSVAVIDDDLRAACLKALTLSRETARAYAEQVGASTYLVKPFKRPAFIAAVHELVGKGTEELRQ